MKKHTDNSLLLGKLLPALASAAPQDSVVAGITAFALDLYAKLQPRDGNLFLSPYSISTALALTYGGARGETASQMAEALHFGLPQNELHPAFAGLEAGLAGAQKKDKVRLGVANSLWPQQSAVFLPDYLGLCKTHYGTTITPLDYANAAESARESINHWVEDTTSGKITDLIAHGVLNSNTRMVLVNAIYFKGDWASQFKAEATQMQPFHLSGGKTGEVPMMFQKQDCGYRENADLQVLELPYAGNDLSMIVLLPRKADGLAEMETKLTPDNLKQWTGGLERQKVEVFLPQFKLTSQFSLKDQLSAMGMTSAFSDNADFSGMNGQHDLFLGAVIHQAFVDVNEEGTVAAAATGAVIQTRSRPQPVTVFRADHPFLFMIRDRASGSILFMGRLSEPAKE